MAHAMNGQAPNEQDHFLDVREAQSGGLITPERVPSTVSSMALSSSAHADLGQPRNIQVDLDQESGHVQPRHGRSATLSESRSAA